MFTVLAERRDSTAEVILRWDALDNRINLMLHDVATGMSYSKDIPSAAAMDAFNHPYCYVIDDDPMQTLNPVIKEYV